MRIVLSTFGTTGDNVPLCALAARLDDRGHDVVMLADGSAGGIARAAGVNFVPLSGDVRAAVQTKDERRSQARILLTLTQDHAADWLNEINEVAEGADILLGSSLAWMATLMVARARGVPAVGAAFQPTIPTRSFTHPLLGNIRLPPWLRRPAGRAILAAIRHAGGSNLRSAAKQLGILGRGIAQPDLLLGAWSEALVPYPPDWPASGVQVTGAWHRTGPGIHTGFALSRDLEAFIADGPPPVYIGFGSMSTLPGSAELRRNLLTALDGRRAVLADGWSNLAQGRSGRGRDILPNEVLRVAEAPHDWLLPRCAMAIHHCGAGTSHAVARAGIPSIPLPMAGDQFFWARRLVAAGLAPRVMPRHPQVSNLRLALDRAAGCRPLTRAASTTMRTEDGTASAAVALERLAHGR